MRVTSSHVEHVCNSKKFVGNCVHLLLEMHKKTQWIRQRIKKSFGTKLVPLTKITSNILHKTPLLDNQRRNLLETHP